MSEASTLLPVTAMSLCILVIADDCSLSGFCQINKYVWHPLWAGVLDVLWLVFKRATFLPARWRWITRTIFGGTAVLRVNCEW
jgi:hypothetical protein